MSIDAAAGSFWKRLAWFVGIWAASVALLALVAYGLRAWLHP